jgi:thiamine pyrophosphate-dependent acetolactate synthase large subunit-like protein
MALAAALARPARPVVLAVGDGGIGASFGELTLAAERRLPLLVLHLSDGGYASIRGRAIRRGLRTGPLEMAPRGWAHAAEALGMPSAELAGAGAADELRTLLYGWDPGEGPLFLTCRFDPADYLAMTEGLR